jgi:hypothetical protein
MIIRRFRCITADTTQVECSFTPREGKSLFVSGDTLPVPAQVKHCELKVPSHFITSIFWMANVAWHETTDTTQYTSMSVTTSEMWRHVVWHLIPRSFWRTCCLVKIEFTYILTRVICELTHRTGHAVHLLQTHTYRWKASKKWRNQSVYIYNNIVDEASKYPGHINWS